MDSITTNNLVASRKWSALLENLRVGCSCVIENVDPSTVNTIRVIASKISKSTDDMFSVRTGNGRLRISREKRL